MDSPSFQDAMDYATLSLPTPPMLTTSSAVDQNLCTSDQLCTNEGLRLVIEAVLDLHEKDNGTRKCCFVIAGSFAAKIQAKHLCPRIGGESLRLEEKLHFNDIDVFYSHDWVPCGVKLDERDFTFPGFIDGYYRDLVVQGDDDNKLEILSLSCEQGILDFQH